MPIDERSAAPARSAVGDLGFRRERTRQRMLDAAFKLLGREQGRNVRIEEICADAGVSRATFYNYFASMEEMYAALSFDLSHAFNVAARTSMARMEDTTERAAAGIRYYLDRAHEDPRWGWAMVHISAAGPLFGTETFGSVLASQEEGIASGEFNIADARIGRDLVLGTALAAMITLLREDVPPSYSRSVALHVLRALGVPEAKARAVTDRPLPDPTVAAELPGPPCEETN